MADLAIESVWSASSTTQRECALREFMRTPDGRQLIADDVNGNRQAWVDSEGWPLFVMEAVRNWGSANGVICGL